MSYPFLKELKMGDEMAVVCLVSLVGLWRTLHTQLMLSHFDFNYERRFDGTSASSAERRAVFTKRQQRSFWSFFFHGEECFGDEDCRPRRAFFFHFLSSFPLRDSLSAFTSWWTKLTFGLYLFHSKTVFVMSWKFNNFLSSKSNNNTIKFSSEWNLPTFGPDSSPNFDDCLYKMGGSLCIHRKLQLSENGQQSRRSTTELRHMKSEELLEKDINLRIEKKRAWGMMMIFPPPSTTYVFVAFFQVVAWILLD